MERINQKVLLKIITGIEEKTGINLDYHHPDFQKFVGYVIEQYNFMNKVIPQKYSDNLISDVINQISVQMLMSN